MKINILPQPDDTTCGPTCLHAVYGYFGLEQPLEEVISRVNYLIDGGTLAVFLGQDALRQGFAATIYTFNLRVFDPSWSALENGDLVNKLRTQLQYKSGKKFTEATFAYIDFLEMGGKIHFDDLNPELLTRHLKRGLPVLTGLSATYLYNTQREYTNSRNLSVFDDLRGEPQGHFVVLSGQEDGKIVVADPSLDNPFGTGNYYLVDLGRLLNSIMLGVLTYDANILIIEPAPK